MQVSKVMTRRTGTVVMHGGTESPVIVRRSTALRVGTVVTVLAALGIGFGIGLAISSPPPPANRVVTAASTTHGSPTTPTPRALPCGSGSKPQMRPTSLYIGCSSRVVFMTGITWSSWASTGGSGSGTLHVNDCQPNCATGAISSTPAFVVVSNPVGGIFRDVVMTPPGGTVTPQSSSRPGSGWGSG